MYRYEQDFRRPRRRGYGDDFRSAPGNAGPPPGRRRYQRGFVIGPTVGGSDIGYRAAPMPGTPTIRGRRGYW